MPLTKEQLLIPRYKVIAYYPQPPFNEETDEHKFIEGDLLIQSNVNGVSTFRRYGRLGHMSVGVPCCPHPEKYPKIFQPLHWWSDRNPEDMPEYYKHSGTHGVYKTNFRPQGGVVMLRFSSTETVPTRLEYTEPATEEEYIAYINQKQQ